MPRLACGHRDEVVVYMRRVRLPGACSAKLIKLWFSTAGGLVHAGSKTSSRS